MLTRLWLGWSILLFGLVLSGCGGVGGAGKPDLAASDTNDALVWLFLHQD